MDPKGKGMVVNDKEKESLFNEPRDDMPTELNDNLNAKLEKANKSSSCVEHVSICNIRVESLVNEEVLLLPAKV